MEGDDSNALKSASDKLTELFHKVSADIYNSNANQQNQAADENSKASEESADKSGDDVVDAEFEEVA